jgi:hypothetical protein
MFSTLKTTVIRSQILLSKHGQYTTLSAFKNTPLFNVKFASKNVLDRRQYCNIKQEKSPHEIVSINAARSVLVKQMEDQNMAIFTKVLLWGVIHLPFAPAFLTFYLDGFWPVAFLAPMLLSANNFIQARELKRVMLEQISKNLGQNEFKQLVIDSKLLSSSSKIKILCKIDQYSLLE